MNHEDWTVYNTQTQTKLSSDNVKTSTPFIGCRGLITFLQLLILFYPDTFQSLRPEMFSIEDCMYVRFYLAPFITWRHIF